MVCCMQLAGLSISSASSQWPFANAFLGVLSSPLGQILEARLLVGRHRVPCGLVLLRPLLDVRVARNLDVLELLSALQQSRSASVGRFP